MKHGQHSLLQFPLCRHSDAENFLSTFLVQLAFQIKQLVWRQILCSAIQGWTSDFSANLACIKYSSKSSVSYSFCSSLNDEQY